MGNHVGFTNRGGRGARFALHVTRLCMAFVSKFNSRVKPMCARRSICRRRRSVSKAGGDDTATPPVLLGVQAPSNRQVLPAPKLEERLGEPSAARDRAKPGSGRQP